MWEWLLAAAAILTFAGGIYVGGHVLRHSTGMSVNEATAQLAIGALAIFSGWLGFWLPIFVF